MEKIVIAGAGAHAAELEGYIQDHINRGEEIKIIGYLDDSLENHKKYNLQAPLLGGMFSTEIPSDVKMILGINSIGLRRKVIEYYKAQGVTFANFIHFTSRVFENVEMGEGNIICPYIQIGPLTNIGSFNTFNNKASIGHDTQIGDNNVFCPNVGLSGNTKVGTDNFFSLNVATIPSVSIGNKNVIAPNMVIEKSIADDSYFFHRFKEVVLTIPKG